MTQVQPEQEAPNPQKLELKALALKEAVTRSGMKAAEAAAEFEDQIANLRVELTMVTQERDQLKSALEARDAEVTTEAEDEVLPEEPKSPAKRKN